MVSLRATFYGKRIRQQFDSRAKAAQAKRDLDLEAEGQAVRKHCFKLGLNPPERGYWQKKRAGKF